MGLLPIPQGHRVGQARDTRAPLGTSDDLARGIVHDLNSSNIDYHSSTGCSSWEILSDTVPHEGARSQKIPLCGFLGDLFSRIDLLAWNCRCRPA
jgi:hypothetical protein